MNRGERIERPRVLPLPGEKVATIDVAITIGIAVPMLGVTSQAVAVLPSDEVRFINVAILIEVGSGGVGNTNPSVVERDTEVRPHVVIIRDGAILAELGFERNIHLGTHEQVGKVGGRPTVTRGIGVHNVRLDVFEFHPKVGQVVTLLILDKAKVFARR